MVIFAEVLRYLILIDRFSRPPLPPQKCPFDRNAHLAFFCQSSGSDALQGIGQQWPAGRGKDDRWRPGDAMGVVRLLKEQQPDI